MDVILYEETRLGYAYDSLTGLSVGDALGAQYFMPGRYLYNLANLVETRTYPNGLYDVDVEVSDMRGNSSEAALEFKIDNKPGTETGCAPQAPPSSVP